MSSRKVLGTDEDFLLAAVADEEVLAEIIHAEAVSPLYYELLRDRLFEERRGQQSVSDKGIDLWRPQKAFKLSIGKQPQGLGLYMQGKRQEWQQTIKGRKPKPKWRWLIGSLRFMRERWEAFAFIAVVLAWYSIMRAAVLLWVG